MILLSSLAFGQKLQAADYEEITVGAAAVTLTAAKITAAAMAAIKFDGNGGLRFRVDGPAPTSAVGWAAYDGDEIYLNSLDGQNLSMIRIGTTNMTARVIYYRGSYYG